MEDEVEVSPSGLVSMSRRLMTRLTRSRGIRSKKVRILKKYAKLVLSEQIRKLIK